MYVSQSDYRSCDLYKQRLDTRERERERVCLFFVRICMCDVNVGEKKE